MQVCWNGRVDLACVLWPAMYSDEERTTVRGVVCDHVLGGEGECHEGAHGGIELGCSAARERDAACLSCPAWIRSALHNGTEEQQHGTWAQGSSSTAQGRCVTHQRISLSVQPTPRPAQRRSCGSVHPSQRVWPAGSAAARIVLISAGGYCASSREARAGPVP
jgi:hypothetical protein